MNSTVEKMSTSSESVAEGGGRPLSAELVRPIHQLPTSAANLILVAAVLILLAFSTYHGAGGITQASIQVVVFSYFIALSHRYPEVRTPGWSYILIGVNLITFGALIDISQHVFFLRSAITVQNESFRFFLRQIVGANTGFLMLALGFYRWVTSFLASRKVLEDLVRKYEAEMIRNEKYNALAGLVSGVAHELNNPLTILMGYTEILAARSSPDIVERCVREMKRAAARCQKVASNLLLFARQQVSERNEVNVSTVLDEAVELLVYQFRVAGIEVEKDYSPETPSTVADRDQLLQVFFNLINNARQAMTDYEGQKLLKVGCRREGQMIRIEISDTGPGISHENLEKIFRPFFTTKPPGVGTGLGLSICFGILKSHGGEIRVTSEPRKRTTFVCELPIAQKAVQVDVTEKATEPVVVDYEGKAVLLVDDEEGVIDICKTYIEAKKGDVDYCKSGNEAASLIKKKKYDAILLDVRMPVITGKDLYLSLSDKSPDVLKKVVFISGDTANGSTIEFLRSTKRPFLLKPFTLSAMDKILEQLFSGKTAPHQGPI